MILQNCTDVTIGLSEGSDMRKKDVVQIEKNLKKCPQLLGLSEIMNLIQ